MAPDLNFYISQSLGWLFIGTVISQLRTVISQLLHYTKFKRHSLDIALLPHVQWHYVFFLFITFKHHIASMLQNILVFKVFQQHNLDLAYFPRQQEHSFPYFACYLIPQTIFESLHLYHCHSLRKHCKFNRTKFCSDASFQPIWNKHFSGTAL